jgi:hypothetical protein
MDSFTLLVLIGSTLGALMSVVAAVLAIVRRKNTTSVTLNVGRGTIVLSSKSSSEEIESARQKFSESLEALKR